ncbi:MAG TPA: VTT domain-containing protein [Chloroflexota bacterium]|nr:VTT domain-containing protein [Chloroflexota bacterium]
MVGSRAFDGRFRYLKPEHLAQARAFFDRHGGKAVILARYVPLMRALVPFVSGAGAMDYGRFLTYNIIGSIVWVSTFLFAGYFFGSLPIVQDNFSLMLLAVVILSFVPAGLEFSRNKISAFRQKKDNAVQEL